MRTPAPLYDAFIGVQVQGDTTGAVADALETDMSSEFATRTDLRLLRSEFKHDLSQQTVRLGVMMAGALTLLFAALKLVP